MAKLLLEFVELCFVETKNMTGLALHPTPNLQITSVGDEEWLPWTLSRLKWFWPGSTLCDLNHPVVWQLEGSQPLLQGRFWPSLHVLRWPARWVVCLSLVWHEAISPCCETVSQKDPVHAGVVEGTHHPTDETPRGSTAQIACRSHHQQPPCFWPVKLAHFLVYGQCESCIEIVSFFLGGWQGSNW